MEEKRDGRSEEGRKGRQGMERREGGKEGVSEGGREGWRGGSVGGSDTDETGVRMGGSEAEWRN